MTMRKRSVQILVLVVLFLFGTLAASASHVSGIRVTQTGGTGFDVDIDVTEFYTISSTAYTTAYLGSAFSSIAAIDWGDGSTVPPNGYGPSTGIPLIATSTMVNGVPSRAYRGSFSHSYAAPGAYTITARSVCCAVYSPTNVVVTGYLTTSSYLIANTISVVAGGVAAGIPTLSGYGLILLAASMVLLALLILRRQGHRSI